MPKSIQITLSDKAFAYFNTLMAELDQDRKTEGEGVYYAVTHSEAINYILETSSDFEAHFKKNIMDFIMEDIAKTLKK